MSAKGKSIKAGRLILSIILFLLCAVLLVFSVAGYVFQGEGSTEKALSRMRTTAVLNVASNGIIENIATQANAAKLKELRAREDFRSMGMDEVKELCAQAADEARAEAEAKYSNTESADTVSLEAKIDRLEQTVSAYNALYEKESDAYSDLYNEICDNVASWIDISDGKEDADVWTALCAEVPALATESNAHFEASLVKMARKYAEEENAANEKALYEQLLSGVISSTADLTELSGISGDDEALWNYCVETVPSAADLERFQADLLKDLRSQISAAEENTVSESASSEEEITEEAARKVDTKYFVPSENLNGLEAEYTAAYDDLWNELVEVIPDLADLDNKMKKSIRETMISLASSRNGSFAEQYGMYAAQNAARILEGKEATRISIAANAERFLIAFIALLLLTLTILFWKSLTTRLGVPRTIITLFLIYLLMTSRLFSMNISLMIGDILERVCMYGILALAMLPGIQCGIGLNMGMTLGCIAGLLSTVISLQYNMTGAVGLIFSCVVGAIIAIPLGWAYSLLLNKMQGNEMTIATYVGFSFVSLMCIGWMLLPFNNTKIIWLLRGRGLRVTHSLLGSFAHLLDEFGAFEVLGVTVPTGCLVFFLLCCLAMWLFSRSKVGIAMTAVGANPRFAEASGINVNHMRSLGTILSTVIAAVGIVIYSQAFGYAQLYTAPRQLGFLAASAILIGGATVSKAKVSHVVIGVFLFEGVLAVGQQIANAAFAGGGLSEVMRIMISNGIILYALTQSGGGSRE